MEGETLILTFSVPWAALCSDNRKFKFRFVLSPQYRDAKLLVGTLASAAAKKAGWPLAVVDLGLYVLVREPDRRRRDLNFSKNLKDGITDVGGVWVDDRQVRDERWVFQPAEKGKTAGATITIWRLHGVDTAGVLGDDVGRANGAGRHRIPRRTGARDR
jgi:Holliday junction resolvase RusA-like endonuclease